MDRLVISLDRTKKILIASPKVWIEHQKTWVDAQKVSIENQKCENVIHNHEFSTKLSPFSLVAHIYSSSFIKILKKLSTKQKHPPPKACRLAVGVLNFI